MAVDWWYGLVGMQRPRSSPYSWVRQYDELAALAQEVEKAGFDSFWLTEHHFWYDGYLPSLLLGLAGIARRTTHIRIGTGALLLPLHDPLRVAEEAVVVDNLSNGRLELGIGVGYRPEEFVGLDSPKKTRGARCREAMEFLRQVLAAESDTFNGKYYHYEDINLTPRPIQTPPPIWYAAGGADATAYEGGKSGLNYWAGPATSSERSRELLATYGKGVADAGLEIGALGTCICRDVAIAETKEDAWGIVENQIMPMYVEQLIGFGFLLDDDGKPLRSLEPGDPAYQGMLGSIVWGTPASVTRQIQDYVEMGFTDVMPRIYGASWDMRIQFESLDMFARQVMPHFA
jgi:alkanesulfonate monooxygenase SsuD/methylene tetrahydromethanopterin reductase-like flavin-dependent oxidoreductase (luciferase family)